MPFTIVKKFGPFPAAHFLTGLPEGHQCGRLHGHNYEVEVELSTPDVDDVGFVVDYGELSVLGEYLTARMDHRLLNDEFECNPTAENIARHIFDWIEETQDWPVVAVRVSETPGKTMSEYRPDDERGGVIWSETRNEMSVVNYNVTLNIQAEALRDSLLRDLVRSL
jgi:6-pyruvoyltetrahydropterin/6-carboxytetrahydropterin synthase